MGKWTNYMEGGSQSMNNADQWLPKEEEEHIVSAGNFTPGSYVPEGAVNNYQPAPVEPEWDPESGLPAPRAWDIHYKPSWFVEEQTNRKNPTYTPDSNWSNEEVDAIANYVNGMKKNHPDEWKYGDPGWDTSTQLWQETIKPLEDQYAAVQKKKQEEERIAQQQLQANQPQGGQNSQYYAYHNNNVQTFTPDENGVLSQDQIDAIKAGSPYQIHRIDTTGANYETLPNSGKVNFTVMPATAGTDVKNRKWYQRFSQPVLGAVMSASGPATVAKLLTTVLGGPVGLVYGASWAATAGYSYAKGAGLIKGNDKIDKFIELTDLPDEKMAQLQGKIAYAFEKAGGGDLTDSSQLEENLDFLVKNFDTIWYYAFGEGKASNEYNSDVVDIVSGLTPNMGANVIGIEGQGASRTIRNVLSQLVDNPEDKIWLERNQTTRNNSGLSGVYEIPEELLGTNAITYWLNYGQYLYDHGVTNPKQLEYEIGNAINEVYGDLANYSEFVEHELGDPGNAMEGMQARGLAVVGDVTGDVNLANAARANTGNFAMDLAGQVPGLQGLIETVGRLTGNEIRSSGGIDEVINTWNMENLQSDPSTLTARDRRISGINEDGSLKSLDPLKNPNEIKNPFARGAEKIKQLFQTTNEFRATMAGDSIMNFISTGIEDAMTARPGDTEQARIERATKFVDELANPETISENSPFSKASKTVLFNSIKEDVAQAVRSRRAEIDKAIQDYAKLTPNRQVLYTLSEALGLTPDKLLKKYQDEKPGLAQMIINKADQNGGVIPEIKFEDGTPIPVDSRAFGDLVMSMISPFVGKDAKPYDHRALLLQISSKISDGVTETLINKYHIEPEGWVYRFGDTIKKLQHLWLLGLSPSYLANNVVNNVLTRSALGYGGFLTQNAINDWTKRFGFTPERFNESMAEGILETSTGKKSRDQKSSSEKMREAIRAKRKSGNKFFDKIDSKLDWVSDHMGFFGAISGKIEEMESRQIYTSAMMTYMARTWKPGVNFRKMPVELENLIRAQNPEMVDAIYSAVSGGVNMKEIEKAIYGTYVIPNVRDTLVDAARNLGITDAEDAIIEIFDKGGVMAKLMKALEGKRGDEVDAVIKEVGKQLQTYANLKLRSDLASRAEQIAKDTSGYKFAEAIRLGQDLSQNMCDLWLDSQNANTQLFDRRIREGMGAREFHALYQEHLKELNERWAGIYAEAQQTYSGILKGLGFIDQTANKYVDMMRQRDQLWSDFYQKKQPELFQPYLDALEWKTEDTFDTWDSRVKQAWKDYKQASNTEYLRVIKAERAKQIDMDKVFADGLKAALGNVNAKKVDDVIVPLQNQIIELRQQIIELNLEMRSMTDATDVLNEKSQVYHENDARRAELKQKYAEAQQNLYKEIRALGPQTVDPAVDSATVEVDHEANIRNDITQREADAQQKVAEQLADMDAEDVADTEQMPDSDESNPNNWSEVLRKKTAYKIAKELGATEEEAVAYSQLNKIHASEWEKNHPGMKYKDVGDMTVSYTDQERTVPVEGADGKLYQVETVNRADVNTPEFEAWHGDNPYNFNEDGTPLSGWHGSNEIFTEFSKEILGSNTNAPSAGLGFFFSTSKRNSESEAYTGNALFELDKQRYEQTQERSLQLTKDLEDLRTSETEIPHYETDRLNEILESSRNLSFEEDLYLKRYFGDNYFDNDLEFLLTKMLDNGIEFNEDNIAENIYRLSNSADDYADNINMQMVCMLSESFLIKISKFERAKELVDSALNDFRKIETSVDSDVADPNPYVREFYFSFNKPYIYDYKGSEYREVSFYDVISNAKAQGYDAVILKNTRDPYPTDVIVVFEPNQIKSVYNSGEFSKKTNNVYHQEQEQRIKGQFSIQDGKKLVELFKGSDISTLIHETMGHGWVTTLNDNQVEALAAYNGWTADRYRQLENQWYYDPASMSEADRTAWVDSQEKFAYGFEQFLLEGKAPNSAMQQIFETFKRYLLEIYHGVRHLIYKGEEIDIHKEQHGVTLADIFESMLIDSDREFNIDRTGLADVESNSIEAESYDYTIPDNVREFLITDSRKRAEKIQTMRADAEESMRQETQTFLEENKKWGLTEPESQELVTEIMHGLGLNTDLPENMDLMASVQEKLNRFPGGEKAIKRFIDDHRETASKINDSAMDAMLTGNNPNWRMDDTYKYVLNQVETPGQAKKTDIPLNKKELEDVSNLSTYYVNRKNIYDIAVRAGASEDIANAFSRFISRIADSWERNNPEKDFFTDAPGVGELRVEFGEISPDRNGEYDPVNRMIRIFRNGDFSTLVHELGHGFQHTLDEQQQRELAKYFGIDYDEYVRIQSGWLSDFDNLSLDDRAKYYDIAEAFARGFDDYVITGKAPTTGIARIFAAFKKFLEYIFPEFLDENHFYDRTWYHNILGADYNQGIPWVVGGIRADSERNGVTLQQIFDSMVDTKSESTPVSEQTAIEQSVVDPSVESSSVNNSNAQPRSAEQVMKTGNFIMATDEFKHGRYTCDRVVYHNGEIVAYLPKGMEATTIDAGNGKTAEVIGVSIQHPDQQMYVYDGEVFEEPKPQRQTGNVYNGDAEDDSLGALDPEPLASHKITYEQALPILQEFGRVYKNALNDAMANKTFGSLDAKTKEMVRQYIDQDVRTDLMNTKYKTGKFGEMMRDAALLNYSKRYGFDNAMTLLFPYQFWNTRSMWNWINRMGGKGGKMWRRYARLKELEERNKKELLPSRITGKIGIYLPFLPDWMGDALFMPTSQLSIVGNFMDPLDDWLTDNKAVTATAERYVQEAFDANDITLEEYQTAMDPTKRNGSAVWQEMFARAQTDGDHDRDLGSLFKQYFGMSLPVSVGKALLTDNPEGWTQTPMTRTGTAFRAIFGGDLGKGLEFAMSAPERAMRKAAVAITGNNDFRYQEFGSWGDYYIRNQVWDMVVEGRISAEQAMEACGQKDGNKIWEEAADRQRQELLQKTQLLSATMPFKKMVEDVKNGNQDKLGDDFKYLLAEILTMWTPTSVVRDAERTWRADKAEMNKLYDTGTKDDRSKFYDDHPYYTYNNLRYEDDTEQALRSYLYKSIMDRWYDLSDTEKDELKMAFDTDFQRAILDKDTRAYQTMDLDQLAAYAQAMNGSIPYLATDSLNTTNVPRINTNVIPQAQKSAQETYLQEREKQFPGMADVSNIYYKLPVEDRKIFRQTNPDLDRYWQWNRQYKDAHPDVKDFQNRRTDYYNTLNAENVFSMLDPFTIKELNRAAWTKDKVRKEYQTAIERAMLNAGVTDKYDDFVKVLTNYILGE